MEAKRNILVTTALFYSNGPLHLGHMVESIQADIWVRFQRMRGHNCLFFSGDDTHGTPILLKAKQSGITPEQLIAENYQKHVDDFKRFSISYDNYSSTNTPINKDLTEEFYIAMRDQGHTSSRNIEQTYCTHDKMFLPDRFVKGDCPNCEAAGQYGDSCDVCGATYSPAELNNPACTICGNKPVLKESEHIFFELNHFKDFLSDWVPKHTSKEVYKKLKEWLNEDLRAWDISRDEPYFGFKIPGFEDKYFYVWVDAPIGYIASSLEWGKKHNYDVMPFWKDESHELYHYIGKDITYFHTLFWPAMLKTAGYRTPDFVCIHGFLTVNGEKMSKSKGTFVMAKTYLDHLNPAYLRYYLACKLTDSLDDLDLNLEDFAQRINSDLVGKYANLGSRSAQMLHKNFDGKLSTMSSEGRKIYEHVLNKADTIAQLYEKRQFSKATVEIRDLADQANKYFDEVAPWKLVKEDATAAQECLTATLNIFRALTIYLQPILPHVAENVCELFAEHDTLRSYSWEDLKVIKENIQLQPFQHLIQRVDKKQIDQMIESSKASLPGEKKDNNTKASEAAKKDEYLDIKDFNKVDLRVAKVIEAEDVTDSDKLLKLKVDLGEEQKTIFAGIKKAYKPEQLLNRHVLVVANLKPRKMKFGTSEGMVLCAGEGDQLYVLSPDDGAKAGWSVR